MNRAADLQALKVGLEILGDLIRRCTNLDLTAHDVQNSAALETRRVRLIDEAHGNTDAHAIVRADALKIDVNGDVLHGIELHVAGNGARALARNIYIEHRRQEAPALDDLEELVVIERHRLWCLLVAAIDDGRHFSFTAHSTSGP